MPPPPPPPSPFFYSQKNQTNCIKVSINPKSAAILPVKVHWDPLQVFPLCCHHPAAGKMKEHSANGPMYICSTQSRNLRNLEIALHILRIPKLRANLEIAQPILRLRNTFTQSRNCAILRLRERVESPLLWRCYCILSKHGASLIYQYPFAEMV